MPRYILCLILIFSFSMAKEVDLVLNAAAHPPLSSKNNKGFVDQLVLEAFKRIGKNIKFVHKPDQRSITDSNEGRGDGELMRVAGLSKIYPNLIQVSENIIDLEYVAFSKRDDIKIENWNSLKKYHVGIMRGWQILETNIEKTEKRHSFNQAKHLFKMLENNRLDLVIYGKYLGKLTIKEQGYKNIKLLSPPLATEPHYLYLHKKHKDLVPKLVKSLQSIKKDGTYKKLKARFLYSPRNIK